MAQYFEPGTDTDANFANSVAGQTNSFFLPSVYSKKVLNFFRKASVVEAITNTDYAGEISAYGDSVKIIKEPVISVSDYTRGSDTTDTKLTDQEITLVVDSAKAFKFIVDDIETNMSHVNFKEVASSSAAYALKDAYDAAVLATMFAGVSASGPDHIIGADAEADTPANIVAKTAASYASLRAYAAELEATSLKFTCDIFVSISSTMNLKALALSTTKVISWSVSFVSVVSLPLV